MVVVWPLPLIQLWVVKAVGFIAWVLNVTLGYISQLPLAAVEGINLSVLQVIICYIIIVVLIKIIAYMQVKV